MNRRDLLMAMAATALTGEGLAAADAAPVTESAVFDWNSIPVKPNDHGSSRQFFDTRTVSLEHFELHVTTLDAGKMPHAPHKHPNEEMMIVREGTLEALQNGEWKRVVRVGDLQRVEPTARAAECGRRAGGLSRDQLEDGGDSCGDVGPARACAGPGSGRKVTMRCGVRAKRGRFWTKKVCFSPKMA